MNYREARKREWWLAVFTAALFCGAGMVLAQESGETEQSGAVEAAAEVAETVPQGAAELPGQNPDVKPIGLRIYTEHCASCHGEGGQGVRGEYSRSLEGDKSITQLASYITKWMPEEDPDLVVGDDATQVARYVYDSFYSAIAQARNKPARTELVRLTVPQYRNSVTDIIAVFGGEIRPNEERGLEGEYFKGRRLDRDEVFKQRDGAVDFDFGPHYERRGEFDPKGFSVRWRGSVIAPETGDYEFIVKTDHATRLYVNDHQEPLIDKWVKSGDETEFRESIYLIAGRAYSLRLEFSNYRQGVNDSDERKDVEPEPAFLQLAWKRPHAADEVIPARHLSPQSGPQIFVVNTPFPPDDRSEGYERGISVSRAWADATTDAAIETANYVVANLDRLARTKLGNDDYIPKLREFSERFVQLAFRRPLSGGQKRLYVERQFEDSPDPQTAVKRSVLLALTSPRFLYLDPGGEYKPSGYDIAERLAYSLWDSIPDDRLLNLAASGELESEDRVRTEAERMLRDPRAHDKTLRFMHTWLQTEHARDLSKNQQEYPGFDKKVATDLKTSLDLTLENIVWSESSSLRDLLLSDEMFVNGRLAQFYGIGLPADAPFQKVPADRPQRIGLLTHPFTLANFAYTDSSSPIHRGVFMSRNILGRGLRPPPEAVAPLPVELHPDLTTRQRVEMQTGDAVCQSCHRMINGLGYAMENFDAVGRYRQIEGGKPIDASGVYDLPNGEAEPFTNAADLARFLADSPETHRAFVVQLFHNLNKQPIMAYGVETPEKLTEFFTENDYNIRKLMVRIAAFNAVRGTDKPARPQETEMPSIPIAYGNDSTIPGDSADDSL